jgi:hypothetical protein
MANSRGGIPQAIWEGIMWKNLLLIVLAGIFLGCSNTAGRKYDTTAIDRIGVGQTTEGELVAMLGPPLTQEKLSNAITMYGYAYGDKCPVEGTSIDSLHVEVYNGVVIKKWQALLNE